MPDLIYANGCSMTYGYELIDDPETGDCLDDEYREAHSWPGRLGAYLGASRVINHGVPASSNERIIRTTVSWLLSDWPKLGTPRNELLVVIGWSGTMRREFYVNGDFRQVIPYHDYQDESLQRLVESYRETAWHDDECASRFVWHVLVFQAFLEDLGVSYLFFDAIESCQAVFTRASPDVRAQAAHVNASRYHNFFELDGAMAGVLSREAPDWRGRHPSESGHDLWARHLRDFLVAAEQTSHEISADAGRGGEGIEKMLTGGRSRCGPDATRGSRNSFTYP